MKSIIITLSINILFLSACGQTKIDCENILNSEPKFVKDKSDKSYTIDSLLIKDLKIIKECGNFDNIDMEIMTGPILGTYLVEQASIGKTITYRSIIEQFDKFKKTDEYKGIYEKVSISKQLENKIVDIKDWEENKVLFIKLGLTEEELINLKEFIVTQSGLNLTYKEVFSKYATINKDVEEKNSTTVFTNLIDYDKALKLSQEKKKPMILFFTGYACANARKMEDRILTDPNIKSILSENFGCYSMYLDDRRPLDLKDEYISKRTGKKITTIGEKFMELEIEKFNNSSQPFFVIIDNNNVILASTGYLNDKNEFIDFLNKGIK